jgi:hypothetical protein
MVTLAVPELVKVTVWELLLPTVTFPKLRLAGLALRKRLTPVPESDTVAGELLALLTTDRLPVTLPVAVGAKLAVKVVLLPALRVKGREMPANLKPAPATLI